MENVKDFLQKNNKNLQKAYGLLNYKIIETSAKTNNAIIFFSGNGIYFPNTEKVFEDAILNNDRYEWENSSKHKRVRDYYKLIIFVRDIYKQWYIKGINSKLNTRDSVISFLQAKTKGYKVSVCGNSAGGYMALLCGVKINAERIFNFSGQFDITEEKNEKNPLLLYHKDDGYSSPINLISDLKFPCERIFYLFPGKCEADIKQYNLIKHTGINVFRIDESEHGKTVSSYCYPFLLTAKSGELMKLARVYDGKIIQKKIIARKVVPFADRLKRFAFRFFDLI